MLLTAHVYCIILLRVVELLSVVIKNWARVVGSNILFAIIPLAYFKAILPAEQSRGFQDSHYDNISWKYGMTKIWNWCFRTLESFSGETQLIGVGIGERGGPLISKTVLWSG